jgi:ribosomal RNA-processing protein 1
MRLIISSTKPDKQARDAAVDSLKSYLRARPTLSQSDSLKLWKGLFYCMWMSDKPRNQQQLARDLAGLVEVLREGVVVAFLDGFWITMGREWGGIDVLRYVKRKKQDMEIEREIGTDGVACVL